MTELIVAHTAAITGRGAAVFFVNEPSPQLPWQPHLVRVVTPSGHAFEAIANVEFARKVPPGEVQALFFAGMQAAELPVGSRISVLGVQQHA